MSMVALSGLGGLPRADRWQAADAADAASPPAVAPGTQAAQSPQYAEKPIDPEYKKRPPFQLRRDVAKIITSNPANFGSDADKNTIDNYYKSYALPRWTQLDYAAPRFAPRSERFTLLNFRRELRRELGAARGGIHDYLSAMVLQFMSELIDGNYHPFAQVNAALMIGELNEEGQSKPYAKALPVLIRIVADTKHRDAVRAAAMAGILRHAEAGINDDAARNTLTTAMLKLLASGVSPALTAPGQVWIRGQAIETLGWLGSPGENGEVFKALLANLGEADLSLLVGRELSLTTRCLAAKALGRLNYNVAKGINAADAANALGQLIVQVCDDALRASKGKGDLALVRRSLSARLGSILLAVQGREKDDAHKGILSVAEGPQKDSLGQLQGFLLDIFDVLNSKESQAADVEAAAARLRDNVSDWLQKQAG